MKTFSLLALGIALLTLTGCSVATPSPDEEGGQQNETQRIVKYGLLLRMGEDKAEYRQKLTQIYQEEIDKFNASHQIMQAALLTGNWTGANASDLLFEQGASGVVGPDYPLNETKVREDIKRSLEHLGNSGYEEYTDDERAGANMVWPQRETVNWVRIGLVSEDEQLVNSFEKAIWAFNATHSGLRLDFTLASGECDGSDEVANNPKSRGEEGKEGLGIIVPPCEYEPTKEQIENDIMKAIDDAVGLKKEDIDAYKTQN